MIEAFGRTDVGRRRRANEDSILVDAEFNLFVVCDGLGGHNAGEVASGMAIETMQSFIQRSDREKEITWPFGLEPDLSFDANRLKTAIRLANQRVFSAASEREDYNGMGTTVVASLLSGNKLTLGSAGDSRCYLLRDDALQQLTRDDSWVSAAWAEGILDASEIERHPFRNVITKALGAKDAIDIDIIEHTLTSGDILVLCSDGLHCMLRDEQIHGILSPAPVRLDEAANRLVDAANEAGGRDNISVVLVRYGD